VLFEAPGRLVPPGPAQTVHAFGVVQGRRSASPR
jgi:hypothetical protein